MRIELKACWVLENNWIVINRLFIEIWTLKKILLGTQKEIQFNSVTQSCWTLCDLTDCSTPGFPVHHHPRSLLKLKSIRSVMLSNHLILCHPLLLLPSILPSIRVFSNELVLCIRWPMAKVLEFQLRHQAFQWIYSELISFWMDWFDLLAVQGTFKSLLQHHSSKAWILQCSVFFMFQFSHPYKTTGKP